MKCMADELKKTKSIGSRINLQSWDVSTKSFVKYSAKLLKITNSGITVELDNGQTQKLGFSHVLMG